MVEPNFITKSQENETLKTLERVCTNCWEKQEWDGKFYKKFKANKITPQYINSNIQDVAKKLYKVVLKEDVLVCKTCKMSI